MAEQGWQKLLAGYPWFEGEGNYPIAAYSEFMPPPRVGRKPYGSIDHCLYREDDPFGWHVTEYEEALELQPGLEMIAKELMHVVQHLGHWRSGPRHRPQEARRQSLLARRFGDFRSAAARTLRAAASPGALQDPGRQRPRPLDLVRRQRTGPGQGLLEEFLYAPRGGKCRGSGPKDSSAACWPRPTTRKPEALADLRKAGFRVYTNPAAALLPSWKEEPLPKWTEPYRWEKGSLRGVRYLLTFCPWKFLPAAVRKAYLAGELHLLPFPGSLVFFGAPPYLELQRATAAGRADSPAAFALPPRGPQFDPHSAVGLAARGTPRQRSRTARLWPGPRHVPPLAPLAADPAPRRPVGRRRHRGQADPRALEHRSRTTSACTTNRWPATPRSGATSTNCCWTVRGRRPTISSTWPTVWPPAGCSAIA